MDICTQACLDGKQMSSLTTGNCIAYCLLSQSFLKRTHQNTREHSPEYNYVPDHIIMMQYCCLWFLCRCLHVSPWPWTCTLLSDWLFLHECDDAWCLCIFEIMSSTSYMMICCIYKYGFMLLSFQLASMYSWCQHSNTEQNLKLV